MRLHSAHVNWFWFLCAKDKAMALKTFVKISNVSNLSDARYCAGMMADVISFQLDPSHPDFVSPEVFKDITNWIAGVQLCGNFGNMSLEDIQELMGQYDLDMVEISNPDLVEPIKAMGKPVFLSHDIQNQNDLNDLDNWPDADFHQIYCDVPALQLQVDEWMSNQSGQLIKAYGLESWLTGLPQKLPFGVAIEGSPEERPGFKDYGLVMDLLEVLEED